MTGNKLHIAEDRKVFLPTLVLPVKMEQLLTQRAALMQQKRDLLAQRAALLRQKRELVERQTAHEMQSRLFWLRLRRAALAVQKEEAKTSLEFRQRP